MSNDKTQTQNTKFFDLHVEGLGYLNRVRLVSPRKGEPFLACQIEALRGDADDIEKTKFDLRVSGEAAKLAVSALESAVMVDKKPVLVGFKLSDIYAESYVAEKGERAGETIVVIKGRLLQVKWAKVGGVPFDLPEVTSAPAPKTGTNDE